MVLQNIDLVRFEIVKVSHSLKIRFEIEGQAFESVGFYFLFFEIHLRPVIDFATA